MEYICSQKLPIAEDGYVPGEGVAFFLVDGQEGEAQLEIPNESYAPVFGNMLTGPALDCAAGIKGSVRT
jgi:hypothetical protein